MRGTFLRQPAENDDNLLFVRERLLRSEVDKGELLDLYARVHSGEHALDDENNPVISVLRLSGIVRLERGCLVERNRIYHRVFDDAWIRANRFTRKIMAEPVIYQRGPIVQKLSRASTGGALADARK
jgi:hypothetical protein